MTELRPPPKKISILEATPKFTESYKMSREYCKTPSPTCILHGLEAIPLGRDRYRFFFQKSSDTKRHWPLKARELCAPTSLDDMSTAHS